jgi:radical SAM-linked protein
MHDSSESVLEGIFARGDRRLGDVIEEAWKNGARFDSWEEHVKLPVWEAALEKHAVVRERYLGTIPVTARLPWDHIDVGLEDGFLATEYRKALKSRLSPPCGKAVGMFIHHTNVEDATADARRLVCYDCGVACDMTQMREERIHFLEKMDAHKRLPILESAASPNTPEAPGIDEEEVEVPAAAKAPLVTYRYRLSYEKLGPVAFLGHLDLVRSLPRVFRRVEVPMAYSQGFHPKPDLVFGPALSLGVPSLAEYVDIKLLADVDAAWLHETLNRAAPEGLHFTGAAKLGPQDPGLNKMISKSVYALAFARSALPNGEEGLRARLDDVMAMPSLLVRREIERNVKMVDVRTYLTRAELGESRAKEAIARAGLIGDLVVVGIETHITGAGAVKASEVAEVLTSAETPFRAVRIALLAPNGETPLAVAGRGPLPKPQAELPPLELPVLAEA